MNHPVFCFLLTLSGLACLPGSLHAADRGTSPYRLSPGVLQAAHYQLLPKPLPASRPDDSRPYARQIAIAADAAGLDPELVHAVIAVESAYQASAVSSKGAIGLMQLMPETALANGTRYPADVSANLRAGTLHLKDLLARFDDILELALAAYNAGEGAVRRYGNAIPPYAETRRYVPAVLARYRANSQTASGSAYRKVSTENYLSGTRLEPATRPARH
jgi:soluble lytic murein transglycosylase-like protein